jgi:hypothetical protein
MWSNFFFTIFSSQQEESGPEKLERLSIFVPFYLNLKGKKLLYRSNFFLTLDSKREQISASVFLELFRKLPILPLKDRV